MNLLPNLTTISNWGEPGWNLYKWSALIFPIQWHHLSYVKMIFAFLIIRTEDNINQNSRKDGLCVKEPWHQWDMWVKLFVYWSNLKQLGVNKQNDITIINWAIWNPYWNKSGLSLWFFDTNRKALVLDFLVLGSPNKSEQPVVRQCNDTSWNKWENCDTSSYAISYQLLVTNRSCEHDPFRCWNHKDSCVSI